MFEKPIAPKDLGGPLRVIVMGRASSKLKPKNRCLTALDLSWITAAEFVRGSYDWPVEFCFIGNRDADDWAVRPIIPQVLALIETGDWDLVVAEDLTRITRYASDLGEFIEACFEADVRVIGVAENFDTAAFDSNAC